MKFRKIPFIFLAMFLFGLSTNSFASNGYFGAGYSAKSKALAGAGVAMPLDSMDAAVNPANMVWVGNRLDLGLSLFSPMRDYTVSGSPSGFPGTFGLAPGSVESDGKTFFIPNFGRNWMLGEKASIGVSVYGNGGMNTEWTATNVDPAGMGTYGAGTAVWT